MSDTTAAPATSGLKFPTFAEFGVLLKRGDLALTICVLTIMVVLILPLPPLLLDLALAISITMFVLILMTALFIYTPLEFSSFLTVLLIAPMLRLALNLTSTRLILSRGHEGTDAAGHVIEAFGDFVMSGNLVIGIIVFTIRVIMNSVVIIKGSGRIVEVAARFHLDAMPGKQMAIDADLSAGIIDEKQGRHYRRPPLFCHQFMPICRTAVTVISSEHFGVNHGQIRFQRSGRAVSFAQSQDRQQGKIPPLRSRLGRYSLRDGRASRAFVAGRLYRN